MASRRIRATARRRTLRRSRASGLRRRIGSASRRCGSPPACELVRTASTALAERGRLRAPTAIARLFRGISNWDAARGRAATSPLPPSGKVRRVGRVTVAWHVCSAYQARRPHIPEKGMAYRDGRVGGAGSVFEATARPHQEGDCVAELAKLAAEQRRSRLRRSSLQSPARRKLVAARPEPSSTRSTRIGTGSAPLPNTTRSRAPGSTRFAA